VAVEHLVASGDAGVLGVGDPGCRQRGDEQLGFGGKGGVGHAPVAGACRPGADPPRRAGGGWVGLAGLCQGNEPGRVVGGVGQLGGPDDLVFGDGGLGVVALQEPVASPQHPAVGVGGVRLAALAFLA
jgi:hypothetical protein